MMKTVQALWMIAAFAIMLATAFGAPDSTPPPNLAAVTNHFASNGFTLEGVITRFSGETVPKDGFETVEMIRVVNQNWKTQEEKYSFKLWRHKTLSATKKRLELGKMMKWPMIGTDMIVLQWDSGSEQQKVFAMFESFKKQKMVKPPQEDRTTH